MMCMILVNVPKHKYAHKWSGPYVIKDKINDHNYVISIEGKDKVVSISKMKHYRSNKYSSIPINQDFPDPFTGHSDDKEVPRRESDHESFTPCPTFGSSSSSSSSRKQSDLPKGPPSVEIPTVPSTGDSNKDGNVINNPVSNQVPCETETTRSQSPVQVPSSPIHAPSTPVQPQGSPANKSFVTPPSSPIQLPSNPIPASPIQVPSSPIQLPSSSVQDSLSPNRQRRDSDVTAPVTTPSPDRRRTLSESSILQRDLDPVADTGILHPAPGSRPYKTRKNPVKTKLFQSDTVPHAMRKKASVAQKSSATTEPGRTKVKSKSASTSAEQPSASSSGNSQLKKPLPKLKLGLKKSK
eukprot:sb/3466171/